MEMGLSEAEQRIHVTVPLLREQVIKFPMQRGATVQSWQFRSFSQCQCYSVSSSYSTVHDLYQSE